MKKDFGSKTYLYPMPVLIVATYGEDINTGYAVAIKRIFCSRNNKEKEESQ